MPPKKADKKPAKKTTKKDGKVKKKKVRPRARAPAPPPRPPPRGPATLAEVDGLLLDGPRGEAREGGRRDAGRATGG